MRNLVIAIDGYSACGKSTLAKALSKELSLIYIDTGAMYRAVTLYFQRNSTLLTDLGEVKEALSSIRIHFESIHDVNTCFLNGEDVELEIRSQAVSDFVSEVAAVSEVRKEMVAQQRKMGEKGNVVLDGRDIGTVVFPNADYKFFITAGKEVRALRRLLEYESKGISTTKEEVLQNLEKRDFIDSTRKDSPLKVAKDAITIDNSFMSKEEQLALILKIIEVDN